MHLNIEFKARCSSHEKIRNILRNYKADYKGKDHQIDTYFNVNFGKLKLREGKENLLIYYDRKEKSGPKQAKVGMFKSGSNSQLKEILIKSLGILIIVDKKREVYWIDNIKFNLDTVKNLGTFVEVEAIDYKGNIGKNKLQQQCDYYLNRLGIKNKDLIPISYSNMLLRKK